MKKMFLYGTKQRIPAIFSKNTKNFLAKHKQRGHIAKSETILVFPLFSAKRNFIFFISHLLFL